MPYVSGGGEVLDSRSNWRLSYIPELFWAVVEFFVLFFRTMISPSMTKRGSQYTSDYRPSGGPPRPPRRRMGGIGGGGGGPSPPPMAGGG
ncbi:selenoprotein K-like [Lingula anatina]|uniref:Selenoprotein K n=1 Tax=Lingula anatina TaxID=7574 RepID=A0A1S3K2G1_LINAN|nr:selenoprotein K [Lingula anatina]XP_013416825.1 selenoprotein K-like [Lingula anatina]|eukprot:XP_013407766.1 selenoprotein K [Lingula anatina]